MSPTVEVAPSLFQILQGISTVQPSEKIPPSPKKKCTLFVTFISCQTCRTQHSGQFVCIGLLTLSQFCLACYGFAQIFVFITCDNFSNCTTSTFVTCQFQLPLQSARFHTKPYQFQLQDIISQEGPLGRYCRRHQCGHHHGMGGSGRINS